MAGEKSIIPVISLILSGISLVLIGLIYLGSMNGQEYDAALDKKLAGELADNNLYKAAIDKYKKIMEQPSLDIQTRANLNYLIAQIYFDNLFDYENAAAHYVMARSLNPEGSFFNEAGRKLITSLEKMGRILDAKRELDKAVNIDSVYAANKGETLVAKIGERPIFLSEIEKAIQNLPGNAQMQFIGKAGKTAFLNQYLAFELMYMAAMREGFDTDTEILRKKEDLGKQLLIEKYVYEKVLPEVNVDTLDIRNYYAAHKGDKYDNKNYDDVKNQVVMDYQKDKAQQAFGDYVAKLSAVEKVQIFEENIK